MEKLIKAPQSHIPSAMNAADKEGHTPLALAIYYKRTAQVRMLLKMGCNTNVRDRSQGTVLHYCAQEGGVCNTIYIDLLIEHGADISILDRVRFLPPTPHPLRPGRFYRPYTPPSSLHRAKRHR